MTLRRRLIFHATLMLLGIAALAAIAISSVARLREDYSVALRANQQLRDLYSIGVHVSAARSALLEPNGSGAGNREWQSARDLLELDDAELTDLPHTSELRAALVQSISDSPSAANTAFTSLADASAAVRQRITTQQALANRRNRQTLISITVTALATLAGMVWLLRRQYRSITQPLDALHSVVAKLAGGDFASRASADADAEFASLAVSFNRMADELATMHAHLEQRVATKSRELSQAQRLASIGYLAAGVAHEINNPLGIIAGYGQRTLRRLDDAVDAEKIKQTLGIICDEAFRCKKITDRLLMLARPASTQRQAVHLPNLIEQTIASVATLRPLEGREIHAEAPSKARAPVLADPDALRQVLLNLLINAVEATEPKTGCIVIESRDDDEAIELIVRDNGRGISAERLPHIFEPFVTDQRSQRPGTGLGLAIALSIVSDHGGAITVSSEGAGRGAQFIVKLPHGGLVASATR